MGYIAHTERPDITSSMNIIKSEVVNLFDKIKNIIKLHALVYCVVVKKMSHTTENVAHIVTSTTHISSQRKNI